MQNRELFYQYKGSKCGSCGKTVQEMLERWGTIKRLFELNHIDPMKKHPDYKNMIRRSVTSEQLNEVDKCVLLCVECHKALHAQNISAHLHLTVTLVDGRQVSQDFKGQMLIDKRAMEFHFFTDEKFLLLPYWVHPGRAKPVILTGKDLYDKEFMKLLAQTRSNKKLRILGSDGKIQLRALKLNDKSCSVEYSPKFHLMEFEGRGDDGLTNVWTRGGMAIYRDATDRSCARRLR